MLNYRVGAPLWRVAARAGWPMQLRVDIHFDKESASYWASSEDLPGLTVAGATLDELQAETMDCVAMLLEEYLSQVPRRVTTDMHLVSALGAA